MLPDDVTQTVAIEFFKSIYHKVVNEFPEPNFDQFTVLELKSFFSLSDMYVLDSSKIVLKKKFKEKCEKKIDKYYPKQQTLEIGALFSGIPISEREVLSQYFILGTQLGIVFQNFKYWYMLFYTYRSHKKHEELDLKVFEYLATQRPKTSWKEYSNFGHYFFLIIAMFAGTNTKNLTWKDVTKNIKFKRPKKGEIEDFILTIKQYDYYKPLLENKTVLLDIFLTMYG
jgi:hypothetical protein